MTPSLQIEKSIAVKHKNTEEQDIKPSIRSQIINLSFYLPHHLLLISKLSRNFRTYFSKIQNFCRLCVNYDNNHTSCNIQ